MCSSATRASGHRLAEVEPAVARLLKLLPEEDRQLAQITNGWSDLLRHGVGFHHAGIVPPSKEMVEESVRPGILSVVCATDTLSVGINMPARTVVISR